MGLAVLGVIDTPIAICTASTSTSISESGSRPTMNIALF